MSPRSFRELLAGRSASADRVLPQLSHPYIASVARRNEISAGWRIAGMVRIGYAVAGLADGERDGLCRTEHWPNTGAGIGRGAPPVEKIEGEPTQARIRIQALSAPSPLSAATLRLVGDCSAVRVL